MQSEDKTKTDWRRQYKEERTEPYAQPSRDQLAHGELRRRTDLIREARELGRELLEVWET